MEVLREDRKDYKFMKEISSDTLARALHVKVNKKSYQVVVAFLPRLTWYVMGYEANRAGQPLDFSKFLFKEIARPSRIAYEAQDEDLEFGVDLLLEHLDGLNESDS